MDENLLEFYLALKGPEAGEWNLSPECLHAECMTRDYARKHIAVTDGLRVCNVGIGTGDWDDFLGYWLKGKGHLTSIDIDAGICRMLAYRQQREKHPNPAYVVNKSVFDAYLPSGRYDLVTLIGSAINEAGESERCLDSCIRLLKQDGCLLFMAHLNLSPIDQLKQYISARNYRIERLERHEAFLNYPFYICSIYQSEWRA